ncbi:MAG: hypothetical protein MUO63_03045, partial [Desulfobulbaceae bacterium]|nr:hypothetical protein [Desulfobulbaceae bacterium]
MSKIEPCHIALSKWTGYLRPKRAQIGKTWRQTPLQKVEINQKLSTGGSFSLKMWHTTPIGGQIGNRWQ